MDPLGFTTHILSIVNTGLSIVSKLRSTLRASNVGAEVHLYTLLLREISDVVLQNAEVLPSAIACLQQCQERLDDLQRVVSASKPQFGSIQLAVSDFRSSVMLLRDIVME